MPYVDQWRMGRVIQIHHCSSFFLIMLISSAYRSEPNISVPPFIITMILTSTYVVAALVITVDEYICGSTNSTIVGQSESVILQLDYLAIPLPHTFQNEHPSSLWKYHCTSKFPHSTIFEILLPNNLTA